ncbi:hypothetical protein GCM10010156_61430 [Planobispora rosea]|uniref:Uncharacterized protein n=1 Tax=Planobispora rosea TaxID=35762 RepID=A0A8J3S9D8_PLARO|nr:hypothetical protein GCM10010156_61430 [Planobispora rosea]GIH87444.1 hypothetical protein Pro02_58520 [Planobispora rosea]
MVENARTVNAAPGRWRRWSSSAGYAAFGWALLYGGFGLVAVSNGTAVFYRAGEPLPVGLNWIIVILAVVASVTILAAVRPRGRRVHRPAVSATLTGLGVLTGAAVCGHEDDVGAGRDLRRGRRCADAGDDGTRRRLRSAAHP